MDHVTIPGSTSNEQLVHATADTKANAATRVALVYGSIQLRLRWTARSQPRVRRAAVRVHARRELAIERPVAGDVVEVPQ